MVPERAYPQPARLYDAYIFDLDGTVFLGDALLPTAGETIATLRSMGRRTVFLSNNPTRTQQEYVSKLTRLGVPVTEADIIHSSQVMVNFLRRRMPDARLFVVGEEPLKAELSAAGFELTEDPEKTDAVIASFDRTFVYRKLQIAFDAIRAGARFFATNADRYCPVPGGGEPDAAAVIAAIEACTATKVEAVVGKPSEYTIDAILDRLGLPAECCVITGDRLETDVVMGLNAGMDASLVLTGATSEAALAASPIRPTYVLRQLEDLLPETRRGEIKVPDKVDRYRRGAEPLKKSNRFWPLYGAGLENLGQDGQPIGEQIPQYGPDELLIRHDACGLCFSDIKVIKLGEEHPRIFRDIKKDPVVLGHEIALTVVGVGDNLKDRYHVGDRFIVQADIWKNGVNLAYGYMTRGGLSQYNVIDDTILEGDQGNYLLPVEPQTGYAESALTEPWACVTAAYELTYRTGLKDGGTAWVIGTPDAAGRSYTIGAGFDVESRPARLMLSKVPAAFESWLRERAAALGIEVVATDDLDAPAFTLVDDIVLLEPNPELIETVSPHLAYLGLCALIGEKPMARKVNTDLGRVHYNRWAYVGGTGPDIAAAYSDVPIRSSLRPGGVAWFVGAGGPMGRMHVQRAIQVPDGPATIVCTDVSDMRLDDLCTSFRSEAEAEGIEFICLNPTDREEYAAGMARFRTNGFDDIIVLAPVAAVISDSATWLAPRGVMNVFAGVARGTMAELDLSDAYLKQARVIGHSASSIDDLRLMLHQAETGILSPNRSVAAVGSLEAARDGFQAVMDTSFPGKVVIYPQIKKLPLTALADLKDVLPSVYAKLKDGREWTNEAEEEFLQIMLD